MGWFFGLRRKQAAPQQVQLGAPLFGQASPLQMRDILFANLSPVGKPPKDDAERIKAAGEHPIVMTCVRRIGMAAASVRYLVADDDGNLSDKDPLVRKINGGRATSPELWHLVYQSLAVTSRAFVLKVTSRMDAKVPAALQFLRPDAMQKRYDPSTGKLIGYRYGGNGPQIDYAPEQVIEIRHPWLADPNEGFSPVGPGWGPIALYQGFSSLVRKLLENNGGLPGILAISTPDTGASDLQKAKLSEYFERFRVGGDKFGSIALIDTAGGEAKFIKITADLGDLKPTENKAETMREICNIFGVPPILFSMGERSTFENQKEARRYFWLDTIIPGYLSPVAAALSAAFDRDISPDLSEVPALGDYRTTLIDSLIKAPLTINEIRDALGYKPRPEGDVLMTTSSQIPFGQGANGGGSNGARNPVDDLLDAMDGV